MHYLGILGVEFLKTIVIFEISTLELVKHEFLTHTVNFGIGSTFSKGPVSAFLKVRVWFPVCLIIWEEVDGNSSLTTQYQGVCIYWWDMSFKNSINI